MVRDLRNFNIPGEVGPGKAASRISRGGGEWNMDTKGRDGIQLDEIVISKYHVTPPTLKHKD